MQERDKGVELQINQIELLISKLNFIYKSRFLQFIELKSNI